MGDFIYDPSGAGAGSYVDAVSNYSYTEAASPVEETMAQVVFDGSLTDEANLLVILTPALTLGSCSVKLYDLGPVGSPSGSRLVSTLTTSTNGLQRLEQTLTSVAAGASTNEILQAEHIYDVVVTSAGQVGDTVLVGSARIEVTS